MIPLFSRHALTRQQAEQILGRALRGDPMQGERAALQALALLDFDRVRTLLDGKEIGDDFLKLVRERLEAAVRRGEKHFVVSVLVSGNAYDNYARQARLTGCDISATLAAAVERDFARVRDQSRLDAEPVMAELARYVRELVELLKAGQADPALSERTGLSRAAAIDDLIRRGFIQVALRDLREATEDIRATVLDTYQALDALAPYAIAALSLMAHWATHSGSTKLGEVEYAEAARDAGRATWDGHLAARGLALPLRPAADQPSNAPPENT